MNEPNKNNEPHDGDHPHHHLNDETENTSTGDGHHHKSNSSGEEEDSSDYDDDPILNKEAIRVVKKLARFIPGMNQDNQTVRMSYTVPLNFKKQDDNN